MTEYKENTVGWWLSQLKEPLKSRALKELAKYQWVGDYLVESMRDAVYSIYEFVESSNRHSGYWEHPMFWRGVHAFYSGIDVSENPENATLSKMPWSWEDGWEMAKECAPDNWLKPKDGGEDKAIVDSPSPEIPVTGDMIEDFSKRVKQPPAWEIEAPERAVVGYEEPKPIDTIEKKHELRIQALEARVRQLEVQLTKYLSRKNG